MQVSVVASMNTRHGLILIKFFAALDYFVKNSLFKLRPTDPTYSKLDLMPFKLVKRVYDVFSLINNNNVTM